jgi:AI-2 transport protein TqsA
MENNQLANSNVFKFLVMAACVVVLIAGIKAVAPTLNILLLAILIAQCINPLVIWLNTKKIPSGLAIVITLVLVIGLGGFVLAAVGSSIYGIREKVPIYSEHIGQMFSGLKEKFAARGYDVSTLIPEGATSPEKIGALITTALAVMASVLANGIFILILVIILLAEFAAIRKSVEKKSYPEGSFMYRISEINKTTTKFIGITALIGFLQGIAGVIVLLIMGIDFAVTWGVLFFFVNFIPVVGFFLAVIPPVVIALLEQGGRSAGIVFGSWYVINLVFDNIVRPRFLKKEFEVSFLTVIVVLMFWSYVLGPLGAILAIPLSLALKFIYDVYVGDTKKLHRIV